MASAVVDAATTAISKLGVAGKMDVRSQLKGVNDSRYNGRIVHYRGIPYATIGKRFAKPKVATIFPGDAKEYIKFGPRCPQTAVNIAADNDIPDTVKADDPQQEDELRCTNLNVTCPTATESTSLPVLLWIYGGSFMNSYGNAEHRLGDTGPLVAQSVELGKPVVLVTPHYRLNIFSFGDGSDLGEVNLGLQDLQAALEWTKAHIAKFGGDPNNITVGGESAGSIYTHALLASGSSFERAIMASGTMYTSPPQPDRAGFGLIGLIEGNLQLMEFDKGNTTGSFGPEATIAGAPATTLIQCLLDLQLFRMWLWKEPYFKNYEDDKKVFGKLKGLMIGDTKHEGWLYDKGFANVTASKIVQCFDTKQSGPELGQRVAKVYGIDGLQEDHETARTVAMQFIGDARFALPPQQITKTVNKAGGKVYQYYFDEPNAFARSEEPIVRHGVDLFATFGGYDDDVNDETRRVGRMLRTKWIDFINGEEPWNTDEIFVYGPNGMTGAINRDSPSAVHDLNPRRRQAELAVLGEVGHQALQEIWHSLLSVMASSWETDS